MQSNQVLVSTAQRDYSLDIIRLLAMLGVCVLHMARMGGFLNQTIEGQMEGKIFSNLFESPTICAVNLFALLTGYLGIGGKWKVKRLYSLILQTLFYILFFSLCAGHIVLTSYWYVNAYIGLFVLMPWLMKGLSGLTKESYAALLCLVFIVFSLCGSLCEKQLVQNGHNVLWLAIMFAFGGYLKRFPVQGGREYIFLGWLVSTGMLFAVLLLENEAVEALFFRHYESPLILVNSICAFILLKNLKVKNAFLCSLLAWASPLAFGVYLFHCSYYIWAKIASLLAPFSKEHDYAWWIIPAVSLIVFIAGIIFDWIRCKVFYLLRISSIVDLMYKLTPEFIKRIETGIPSCSHRNK